MLEEQKATNVACQAFEAQFFKGHLCVHCFKHKSVHVGSTTEAQTPATDTIKILALDNDSNKDKKLPSKDARQKYDIPKVVIRNQNNLQKDGRGKGERVAERSNRKRAKERTSRESRPPTVKRDATPKSSRQNAMTLNIPFEIQASPAVDNKLTEQGELTNTGINSTDSCSENGSVNINVFASKHDPEPNGNMYPHTSASDGDSSCELSGSYSEQFRKALRPVQKAGAPPKSSDMNSHDPDLPEFLKVAKNLRHIEKAVKTPSVEVHSTNNNNHSVVEVTEATLTNLPDLPNVIGAENDASVEDQQRIVDLKSKLPSAVLNSSTTVTGHETLPKNMGKTRPSIQPLTKHCRQTSDPEIFVTSEQENMSVNINKDRESDFHMENVVVRNSQLSSDVYFGKSPVTSPLKQASDGEKKQDVLPRYEHIADCVTIISQSGEVSYHYSRDKSMSESSDLEPSQNYETPASRSSLYKVVDLSEDEPQTSKRNSRESRNSKEMASGSRLSQTQDFDEGLGLAQQDESKELPIRFSRRNVALVDGVYTPTQFHTDSGINDSMESSDSSDGPKVETPTTEEKKMNTPPYPVILHDDPSPDYGKKKRNSGQYKVPIFIMPKGYDANNVAKHHSASELSPHTTQAEQSIDYLQPKEKNQVKERSISSGDIVINGTHNLEDSKEVSVSSHDIIESRRPSRSRSRTHPVIEETSSTPSGRDNDQADFARTRTKRVAPRPPSVELLEQVLRERDDKLDSLPFRSPPPPPSKHKESKHSTDRSSSDFSEDLERLSSLHISDETNSSSVSHAAKVVGKNDVSQRRISPPMHLEISLERQRDVSPLRAQHESRKAAVPVKKGNNFKARLREFSPSGRRDPSPGKNVRVKDVLKDVAVRRVASPPPPLNLPNSPNGLDQGITSKSKKSKFPWKQKRRKKQDSPEREFNPEAVEKWLVNSSFTPASPTGAAAIAAESKQNPRNSLERLEVINAYRGEPTVAIKRIPQTNTEVLSSTPPKATTPISIIPSSPVPTSNLNSVLESYEDVLTRGVANSASKRKAPLPPPSAANVQETLDEIVRIQKSYSLSPTSRRKSTRGDKDSEEDHVYENMGLGKRNGLAPQKPARRRQRYRTTGFEDMPSRIKRLAPKTPEKPGHEEDIIAAEASPDISSARKLFADIIPLASTPPLKSALKSSLSEPVKVDSDGNLVPRRPVRIVAPEDEVIRTELPPATQLRSDYKNLALIPQADLDAVVCSDAGTQVEDDFPVASKKPVASHHAGTQCSLPLAEPTSLDDASQKNLLNNVNDIHCQALRKLSKPRVKHPEVDWTTLADSVWKDHLSSKPEPTCCSAGAAFYGLPTPGQANPSAGVMVCCDPTKSSQVLRIAELSKSILPQSNLISVSRATKDTVTLDPSIVEPRRLRGASQTSGSIETAVVMTDCVPTMNVAQFVSHNAEKHEYLPEAYEQDVALMLLQLCQGLCTLQSRGMCLESLKLDHLLLAPSGMPGGGQRLLINHLTGAEVVSPVGGSSSDVASKLDQKCHEFDVGILVYEFLHQTNPFSTRTSLIISDYTEKDLPEIPIRSRFTKGLRTIAAKLLAKKPQDRLSCSQAASLLQCLLWGPPSTLCTNNGGASAGFSQDSTRTPDAVAQELERWLVCARASMVSKVALMSLLGQGPDGSGYGHSDQLHCQYLADITLQGCREALGRLYGTNPQGDVSVIDSDLDL